MVEEEENRQYPAYADKQSRKIMIPFGEAPQFDDSTFVPDTPDIVELYKGEYAIVDCWRSFSRPKNLSFSRLWK